MSLSVVFHRAAGVERRMLAGSALKWRARRRSCAMRRTAVFPSTLTPLRRILVLSGIFSDDWTLSPGLHSKSAGETFAAFRPGCIISEAAPDAAEERPAAHVLKRKAARNRLPKVGRLDKGVLKRAPVPEPLLTLTVDGGWRVRLIL